MKSSLFGHLALLSALTMTVPANAWAAPKVSLISQSPMFVVQPVPANLVLMLDDSTSMLQMTLPIPRGITTSTSLSDTLIGGTNVPNSEWHPRTATLNPQYYDPSITYLPWSYDGVRRENSDWRTIVRHSDGFVEGRTLHDPRWASEAKPGTLISMEAGANARVFDGQVPRGFFEGAQKDSLNQDIFLRPLVRQQNKCVLRGPGTRTVVTEHRCVSPPVPRVERWSNYSCETRMRANEREPRTVTCPAANELGSETFPALRLEICEQGLQANPQDINECCRTILTTSTESCENCGVCLREEPDGLCTSGVNCTGDYVEDNGKPVIARYYRFIKPSATTSPAAQDEAWLNIQKGRLRNYQLVEIERPGDGRPFRTFPVYNVDGEPSRRAPRPGQPVLPGHCMSLPPHDGSVCTFDEEAQNFANWYTYYRTRLFAAIAVSAESLATLTPENGGLDRLRVGFGSINYFNRGANPYAQANAWTPVNGASLYGSDADAVDEFISSPGFVSNLGALRRGVRAFNVGSAERKQVFDWLFSLRAVGATPTREAIDSVGRYFSRRDDAGPWSDNPGEGKSGAHSACRRNYLLMLTDGEWTASPPVQGATMLAQPTVDVRPAPPAWIANQGASTPLNARGLDGPAHERAAGGAVYQYSPTSSDRAFGSVAGSPTATMTDVAVYWWSRDLRPDLPNDVVPIEKPPERTNEAYWQHMVTYIVGYGVQASRDTQETRDQINRREAISWETVNTAGNIITDHDTRCRASGDSGCGRRNDMFRASRASRGDFLAALDVASLAAQVASALESINLSEKSGTAVAAPGARLSEGDRVYVASFDPAGWTGELAAYPAIPWLNAVNTQSSLPPVVWTASIPQEPDRFILTSTARNAGSRFSWSTISAAQRDLITEEQLRWVRGDQATEVGRGGVLRPRLRLLGDIVNSTPVLSVPVDSGHGQRGSNADGRGGTAYSSFKQTANSRDAAVLVGANDGMWHVFDAKDGKELLAYVPRAMFPRLGLLADIEYRHRYYVDGQTTVGDVVRGAEWRRIAVATAGAGGRSIFAVDVTDIRSLDENDVLWDLTAEDVPSMGHILAEGVLGRAGDGNWYYFVGNGYESSIDKARLLAINVETGAVTEIGPPDGYAHDLGGPDPAGEVRNQPNGLGGITAVYGSDRTVVAVYAGDRLGQLWKFDLSKVSQVFPLGQAQGKVVAIATDGRPGATATERQSITAAPRVTRHPRGGHLVVFGTGKYFEADDRSSNQLQSIYGIWDKDPTDGIVQRGDQLAEFQLQEWVDQKSKATWRGVTPADMRASIDWRTRRGWVIDLAVNNSLTGERVLATPMLNVGFISVVSYVPTPGGDICGRGGRSFLYRLDVGTDFGRPGFADRTIGDIGVSVPATVAPMRAFVPAPAEEAQRPKATLGGAQTQALVSAPPARPPCGSIVLQDKDATAQGAPALSCGVQTLRVWRDLPRQSASSPP